MSNPVSMLRGKIYQKVSAFGTSDVSLPTFAGLTSVTPNTDGSFSLTHGTPTGSKPPFDVVYYAALGSVSAATLFQSSNRVSAIDIGAEQKVFTLRDGTYFVNGLQYTFGARAKDAFTYYETNTSIVVSTAIASGNVYEEYQTILSALQTIETSFGSIASSIAAGAGQQMSINVNETTMTIDTDGVV